MNLDPRQKPPEDLRLAFKSFQRASGLHHDGDVESIVDFGRGLTHRQCALFDCVGWPRGSVTQFTSELHGHLSSNSEEETPAYICKLIPGLLVIPSLISLSVQRDLLDCLLHRDLVNAEHKTNVHFHHTVSYPQAGKSFFTSEPSDTSLLQPKDSQTHKDLSVAQFLNKKLRWITLGGQYDWTRKEYPCHGNPAFPQDIAELLSALFPATTPEAAIVNLYSPGDTLSLHRDVSEECDNGLISLSIGCDGLFMVGLAAAEGEPSDYVVLRLRSGDALYMQGASRYAWHGVPQILADTCPKELESWPAKAKAEAAFISDNQPYSLWDGWMSTKRINLNVRQMKQ